MDLNASFAINSPNNKKIIVAINSPMQQRPSDCRKSPPSFHEFRFPADSPTQEKLPDCRKSLSFRDFNTSDCGRESLGILHESFANTTFSFGNFSPSSIRRESLLKNPLISLETVPDLSKSEFSPRESIGILNLSELTGRESNIFNININGQSLLSSSPCRDTLLNLSLNSKEPSEVLPSITISNFDANTSSLKTNNSLFNDARCAESLLSFAANNKKYSTASSLSSNPFDKWSFEDPSKIYSISSQNNEKSDIFNNALGNSSDFFHKYNENKSEKSDELDLRKRTQSVPATANEIAPLKDSEVNYKNVINREEKKFWSCENKKKKSEAFKRNSFHGSLNFDEDDDDVFGDSVYIEAKNLAEKIADGSIYEENKDVGILDSTPQPEWPDVQLENDEKPEKIDTETIFKTIDRILPASISLDNVKIKTNRNSNLSNNSNNSRETSHNISNKNLSKEAKEIIQNLSDILTQNSRSDSQISKGRNLIRSLAEILCDNNSDSLEDSGHSSIDEPDTNNRPESLEMLDLQTESPSENFKNVSNPQNPKIVDLSMKNNADTKRLSRSLSVPAPKVAQNKHVIARQSSVAADTSKNRTSSIGSNGSLKNASRSSIAGKLKTSTGSTGSVKKGPLKAVIPVNDMTKKAPVFTTPKKISSTLENKRTSTPINNPKLRPVAQSTPTEAKTPARLQKTKQEPSPLARPNLIFGARLNTSATGPSVVETVQSRRRGSVSEIRRPNFDKNAAPNAGEIPQVKRRGSVSEVRRPSFDKNSVSKSEEAPQVRRRGSVSEVSRPTFDKNSVSNSEEAPQVKRFDKNPVLISEEAPPVRRRGSVSEVRRSSFDTKLKRSYSVGKESGIMAAMSRVRENIANKLKNDNNNSIPLSENKITNEKSLMPKTKTSGKENYVK